MNFPQFEYYEVTDLLQEGGTALVYKGVNLLDGSVIAVKSLLPKRLKDPYIVAKFREEANHYLYLSHPNITRLVDFIERGEKLFLIMEFVEGETLADYIMSLVHPVDDEKLLDIFTQILDTVAFLHQNEILHLDIKPDNIMITPDGLIKILDMGISAKISDARHLAKKCGSPSFMAPEQIKGEELGRYTDIFALGVTLFDLVTGKLPFYGNSRDEIFEKSLTGSYPLLADAYADANVSLQPVIDKCLNPNPLKRYSTCEEMEYVLHCILENK